MKTPVTDVNTFQSEEMSPDYLDTSIISRESENISASKSVSRVYNVDGQPVSEDFLKRLAGIEKEPRTINEGPTSPYHGFKAEAYLNFVYMQRAVKLCLPTLETCIYLYLSGVAHPETGLACVSQKALAGLMGVKHQMTISRAIQALVSTGLIEIASAHSKYHTNVYKIINFVV